MDNKPCRSLEYTNQFSFVCPIFGAETKIGVCMLLRDRVWRGDKPEVRKGCQACLVSSKCPMIAVIKGAQIKNEDFYYSATPRLGNLRSHHVDAIRATIVPDNTMERIGVPTNERMIILAANGLKGVLKGKVDAGKHAVEIDDMEGEEPIVARITIKQQRENREAAASSATKTTDAITSAAQTGDMSAAINEAMKEI